ncbi:hypothetical protein [Streptomyces olivoreticuli]|uniref:hypothetical protein n=1 Tax=Streptomyces olivoreticuli TaxID=68246 RepID=UPI000E258FB4|nr:hypothetical protein [Streptomyces olivoreticuli]
MNGTARDTTPTLATAHPPVRGQCRTCLHRALAGQTTTEDLAVIARLANVLCEDLADGPWRIAAAIRGIAETSLHHTKRNS